MPRRLGDDPLARARSEKAKAAENQGPVALDSGAQQQTSQLGIQSSSRASYNDVFFQRRGGAFAPERAPADVREAPEISEISEIPEIREAAAVSGSESAFEVAADAKPAPAAIQGTEAVQSPPVSIIEEVVAKLNALPSGGATPATEVAQAKEGRASPPSQSQGPSNGGEGAAPEPQKSGGFFKRLFGKFK